MQLRSAQRYRGAPKKPPLSLYRRLDYKKCSVPIVPLSGEPVWVNVSNALYGREVRDLISRALAVPPRRLQIFTKQSTQLTSADACHASQHETLTVYVRYDVLQATYIDELCIVAHFEKIEDLAYVQALRLHGRDITTWPNAIGSFARLQVLR